MTAINEQQLSKLIKDAFDRQSDVVVDPRIARKQLADDIASAVKQFVVGRETIVTGTSPSGPVTGQGIIQDNS